MTIIRDIDNLDDKYKNCVLALGNFDGVHIGHQSILRKCVDLAKKYNVPAAAMTFEPHPREFFTASQTALRICSFRQKMRAMYTAGIEHIFVVRFNARLASTSAENFANNILHQKLRVQHVITGYNFAFGHNRQGDCQFLTAKARQLNFGFTAHPQVTMKDGATISSSAIRSLLAKGLIAETEAMLGRPYTISGHVLHGKKLGRTIGFPTLNFSLEKRCKTRFGVYACRIRFAGENKRYNGVANIGVKPTFSGTTPLLEVHCFDFSDEVYGKQANIQLASFIRDEQHFEGADALKQQIHQDAIKAKELLNAV